MVLLSLIHASICPAVRVHLDYPLNLVASRPKHAPYTISDCGKTSATLDQTIRFYPQNTPYF